MLLFCRLNWPSRFPASEGGEKFSSFHELPKEQQDKLIKKRLSEYTRRVYKKIHETEVEERTVEFEIVMLCVFLHS